MFGALTKVVVASFLLTFSIASQSDVEHNKMQLSDLQKLSMSGEDPRPNGNFEEWYNMGTAERDAIISQTYGRSNADAIKVLDAIANMYETRTIYLCTIVASILFLLGLAIIIRSWLNKHTSKSSNDFQRLDTKEGLANSV